MRLTRFELFFSSHFFYYGKSLILRSCNALLQCALSTLKLLSEWFYNYNPSLNTQSCNKGLFVARDFCFWKVWAAGPVHEKVRHPFILRPQFLQFLEIWLEKSGSRRLVREIWFEKTGSRIVVDQKKGGFIPYI